MVEPLDPEPPPPPVGDPSRPTECGRGGAGDLPTQDATPPALPPPGAPPAGAGAPPQPADAAGRFGARYRLLAGLGTGGMGTVWKAWDAQLQRVVALKHLKHDGPAPERALARFQREARLAARLRHPNIIPIRDVGAVGDRHFITMDCIEGRTFFELLAETRRAKLAGTALPAGRLRHEVELLADVADAVAHAHREGVVHRDLKPTNVLLDREDRPFVTDFGLAKEVVSDPAAASGPGAESHLTLSGQAVGTPAYMSPEQALGDLARTGPATDVWALGVMLYEVLTGALPFDGRGPWEIIDAAAQLEPVAPRRRNPEAPEGLERVCLKALEKRPDRRYAHAGDLALELRRWLRGERVQAARPTVVQRAGRWGVRHRGALAACAVPLVLVAAALGLAWHLRAGRAGRIGALLAEVAAAVADFETAVMKSELPAEAQVQLARQPLGLLERLIADEPACGPAYSWRARVEELLRDAPAAEADYDRGCALAPDRPVVWLLRGLHRVEGYAAARGFPTTHLGSSGARFDAMAPETPALQSLRESGLADLDRMGPTATPDPSLRTEDLRVARATAALYGGAPGGGEAALALLEGSTYPRALRLRALALFRVGRFADAIALLDRVLAEWPQDDIARLQRGAAHLAAGAERERRGADAPASYRQAIADLTECLRRDPGGAGLWNTRGVAWRRLGALQAEHGQDPTEPLGRAIGDFDAAARRDTRPGGTLCNRALARHNLAQARAARGQDPRPDLRAALADYDAAIAADPASALAWANRGDACRELAQAEEARGGDPRELLRRGLADSDESLRRNPEYVAQHLRARLYQALADAEAARGEDPRPSYTRAIAAYDEAVRRDPGLVVAYNNRGNAWQSLGQAELARGEDPRASYRRALASFDATLRLNPEYGAAYNNRAASWLRLAEAELARGLDPRPSLGRSIVDADQALLRNRRLGVAYVIRGGAWQQLGDAEAARGQDPRPSYRKAVADGDAALALNPAFGLALNNRGNARFYLGRADAWRDGADPSALYEGAETDYRAAIGQRYTPAGLNLGLLYQAWGRYADAAAAFRAGAQALPGELAWVRARLAETEGMVGAPATPWGAEFEQARQALRVGDYPAAQARLTQGLARLDAEPTAVRGSAAAAGAARDAHYNLACIESLLAAGKAAPAAEAAPVEAAAAQAHRDRAFAYLEAALGLGLADAAQLGQDADLAPLRADPRWAEVLRRAHR